MYNEIKEIKLWKGDLGMRKIISIILVSSLLLLCLSGCSFFDKKDEITNTDNVGDVDDSYGENKGDIIDKEPPQFTGTPIDKNSDIFNAIIRLLGERGTDIDVAASRNLGHKIELVNKYGAQLLEIKLNPSETYFVCAYDIHYKFRPGDYRAERGKECNWFLFNRADEIPEFYNNEKCVLIFQFNKASSVTNILGNNCVPKIDHFLELPPEFENGYNITPPIALNQTIYYIDRIGWNGPVRFDYESEKTSYFSTSSYYDQWLRIHFIEIDGVNYIKFISNQIEPNGKEHKISTEYTFHDYYDIFADVVEHDKYIYKNNGYTYVYSCIRLDDFFEVMQKNFGTHN